MSGRICIPDWAVADVGVAVEVGGVGGVGDDGVGLGEAGSVGVVVASVIEQQTGVVITCLVGVAAVGWQFLGCRVYWFADQCVC